uniref:Battenin n=1 Tax=Maylandia zebra TaxID=106582 RepID=A0A3P9ARH2_9CICH
QDTGVYSGASHTSDNQLLGLCNNFAYVVMLSAAHDILEKQESRNETASVREQMFGNSSNSSIYDCNPVSTAAVLLADILPTLFIKLFAPFVIHKMPYGIRVLFCAIMAATSFLLVSFSSAVWMSILGVIFASISSGLGELSFLSLTVYFSSVLEGWGSGTGAAGLIGALLYSVLIQAGLSPRVTLLIMLVVPFTMVVSYFLLLVCPPSLPQWRTKDTEYAALVSEDRQQLLDSSDEEDQTVTELDFCEQGLWRFVLPLGVVYLTEYFINQGLVSPLMPSSSTLSSLHAVSETWYQTLYQLGVLLSRSSLHCVKIRKVWILSVLQTLNAVFLLFAVRYLFLPTVWLVFTFILYEGLLGGAAYVNTFHFISKEVKDNRHREFSMAAASIGDSLGITVAGLISLPVHTYFCSL